MSSPEIRRAHSRAASDFAHNQRRRVAKLSTMNFPPTPALSDTRFTPTIHGSASSLAPSLKPKRAPLTTLTNEEAAHLLPTAQLQYKKFLEPDPKRAKPAPRTGTAGKHVNYGSPYMAQLASSIAHWSSLTEAADKELQALKQDHARMTELVNSAPEGWELQMASLREELREARELACIAPDNTAVDTLMDDIAAERIKAADILKQRDALIKKADEASDALGKAQALIAKLQEENAELRGKASKFDQFKSLFG